MIVSMTGKQQVPLRMKGFTSSKPSDHKLGNAEAPCKSLDAAGSVHHQGCISVAISARGLYETSQLPCSFVHAALSAAAAIHQDFMS